MVTGLFAMMTSGLLSGCSLGSGGNFDKGADPDADIASAVARAKDNGHQVIVEVGGDWCPDTRALDAIFASDPKASALLRENFELVRVYTGEDESNRDFLSRFPTFQGVPHLYLLDSQGRLTASASGEAMVTEEPRSDAARRTVQLLETWSRERP